MDTTTANAWQAYRVECPECFDQLLVCEEVRPGDIIGCPQCQWEGKIDGVCGDYRANTSPQVLDVSLVFCI